MAFNFYDTHTLLASVQQLPPLHSFLLDRYFPTNAASDVFATDDVLVEYRKGSKKAAPFVAPRKGGITILREGYTMKRFTPAYIAPKRPLSIDDLKKRGFGEALYTNLTPAQRQGVIMLGDLDELRDMNTRRKEAMAAEVIFTNGCIMHEYTNDLGTYEEKEVRYYDGTSNPAKYTPSADWADTEAGGKQMKRVPEVIDCWFDSGAMPFAQHHYPFENKELFESQFPAQFISEAVDQTRGWFYSLLAESTLLFNKAPYENVVVMGLVLDENGQKMWTSGEPLHRYPALQADILCSIFQI